jgi:hypothetical protein
MNAPFFIIGCVRSGTTFLRDTLTLHPKLASPNETHFYRLSDPYGTPGYVTAITLDPILRMHRQMDGIQPPLFRRILKNSHSRKELLQKYMYHFLNVKKATATRWFDKSPQNIYGALLMAADFPISKFIVIVRNPMDVVSSLRLNKVMHIQDIVGACNYWLESLKILEQLKLLYPERVKEVRYEDLVADFEVQIREISKYLDLEYDPSYFLASKIAVTKYEYRTLFSDQELSLIERLCSSEARKRSYFFN